MARVASASTGAQANWLYSTEDSYLDLLVPGYFDSSFTDFRVDDLIQVKTADNYFIFAVISSDKNGVFVKSISFQRNLALVANSVAIQEPVGLDNPLQIEFGPAQEANDGSLTLSADGTLSVNITDSYSLIVLLQYTRDANGGDALSFARATLNGVQIGVSLAMEANISDQTIPMQFTYENTLMAGDEIKFELYRDSEGRNDGSLKSFPSTIGWAASASASLRVSR